MKFEGFDVSDVKQIEIKMTNSEEKIIILRFNYVSNFQMDVSSEREVEHAWFGSQCIPHITKDDTSISMKFGGPRLEIGTEHDTQHIEVDEGAISYE